MKFLRRKICKAAVMVEASWRQLVLIIACEVCVHIVRELKMKKMFMVEYKG